VEIEKKRDTYTGATHTHKHTQAHATCTHARLYTEERKQRTQARCFALFPLRPSSSVLPVASTHLNCY